MLTYFLFFLPLTYGYEIKATGGGVVKLGSDLELSLEVGKQWDRCRWFVYEHHAIADYEWCSFDLNPEFGNATVHKCEPENLTDVMTYTGNDAKACTITIYNVTEEYNCQWAARLDEDLQNSKINVTIAKDVDHIEIEIEDDLVEGQDGKILCKINGGRPGPNLNFDFDKPVPTMINDTVEQVQNENGIFGTVQEVWIKPKIEDHGKNVLCEAFIQDKENNILYNQSATFQLDIKFKPQMEQNQTVKGNLGENVTITFNFKANPEPESVKWVISVPSQNSSDEFELTPGHFDDKYFVENLTLNDSLNFEASLTIFDLQNQDHEDQYYLEIENKIGKQKYFFVIDVEDADSTGGNGNGDGSGDGNGDDDGSDEPPSRLGGLIVAIGFVAVAILCAVFFFVYKRNQIHNETAPLNPLGEPRNRH